MTSLSDFTRFPFKRTVADRIFASGNDTDIIEVQFRTAPFDDQSESAVIRSFHPIGGNPE